MDVWAPFSTSICSQVTTSIHCDVLQRVPTPTNVSNGEATQSAKSDTVLGCIKVKEDSSFVMTFLLSSIQKGGAPMFKSLELPFGRNKARVRMKVGRSLTRLEIDRIDRFRALIDRFISIVTFNRSISIGDQVGQCCWSSLSLYIVIPPTNSRTCLQLCPSRRPRGRVS